MVGRTVRAGAARYRAIARHVHWAAFAKARGDDPRNEKWFSEGLQRHALKKRTNTGVVFVGLRLLPSESEAW